MKAKTILGSTASKSTVNIQRAGAKEQSNQFLPMNDQTNNRDKSIDNSAEKAPTVETTDGHSDSTFVTTVNAPVTTVNDDDDSAMKQSAFQQHLNVAINDGTNRITIRWTPAEDLHHAKRPGEWTKTAHKMLQELFLTDSGVAYRWESQDLATWRSFQEMEECEVREYISPHITYFAPTRTYIFGVRYGFTTRNHMEWQSSDSTKAAMRSHHVWATTSNSSCHGGKLVHAGFILMKAPQTTHKVRYLQSLRNRLPENTPFFDIVLHKTTPVQQNIHHLVVQCGENHVAPLTKSLSTVLHGNGGAIFLPRVALGSFSSDQVAKYFQTHDNYVKSLRSVTISPMVTNLDTIRTEYYPTGEVVNRTTRDWATAVTLSTGTNARCDIVNGGKDRLVSLLVPRHYYQEVLTEVAKYKLRLNPMERREARFRDSIPGLPEVIQIDTSVQQSLAFLDNMALDDIWIQLPKQVGNKSVLQDSTKNIPPARAKAWTSKKKV